MKPAALIQLEEMAKRSEAERVSNRSQSDLFLAKCLTPPNRPLTMSEWRNRNPKPPLFDLIHKWNLSPDQIELLDYYRLITRRAKNLAENLNTNSGCYLDVTSRNVFVPIYMYNNRQQIERDAKIPHLQSWTYYLSFRSLGNTHIVLIQRARYAD